MTKEEMMKEMYKQKPTAYFINVTKSGVLYECELEFGAAPVLFLVPLQDIGDAKFAVEMDAKLLCRYVVEPITAY